MLTRRLTRYIMALGLVLAAVVATNANAQGITTGGINGFVTDASGTPLADAQISITNQTTGFTSRTISRDGGRFNLPGLEVGGPYTLEARRIGFAPQTRTGIQIQLSLTSRIDMKLEAQATQLRELEIRSTTGEIISPTNTGTKTTVSQQALERAPSLSRNLMDFTRAAPQVSTTGPGNSGGGMSSRMNNVQIDGATERDVFGLGSTGQPGGQISAKAISIDAIKEYQILLAPYDVRQGNFGGLLLNAVTKSGTNDLHGSLFSYYRNQDYGRNVPTLRATEFTRKQSGFTLGGPIIKDKLQFFTANEWQREAVPVSGPFLGQPTTATTAFPFSQDEITRFEAAYKAKAADANPGTTGIVNTTIPMNNLFGRIDYLINGSHRLVARFNYTDASNENRRQNSRTAQRAVYSSNFHTIATNKKAPVVQLFSNFSNGLSNELFLGGVRDRVRRTPGALFPQITVNYTGGKSIVAGSDQFSTGNELDADTYEITDNLTIPRGAHSFVVGTRNELVKIRNFFNQSSAGVWNFADIASFEAGTASSFRRAFTLSQGGNVFFDALQSAFYAQDTWTTTPRLTLTMGLRADISNFLTDNKYAPAIDSAYPGHTTPTGAVQFSPRIGFNYDVSGDQLTQVRGGIGLFVGTPPYVWMENAYAQNGRIITFLNCSTPTSATPSPKFSVDPTVYQTCANGAGTKPIGDVSFLDKSLKFPQPMRANLALDRVLPFNLVATVEGLYSKTLNQLLFVNRNLAAPVGVDNRGRTMYGSILTTGVTVPARPPLVAANGGEARFSSAIEAINQSKDYAYNITGQLRKRYSNNWEGLVAYSYGHARDVQSLTSSTHTSNYTFGRTLSGAQDGVFTGRSLFDQPHKVSAFVTRTIDWGRNRSGWVHGLATDLTVAYAGVSGSPHDYVYGPQSSSPNARGDLNADGLQGNDLIYVPKDVNDPNEIRFSPLTVTSFGQPSKSFTTAEQAAALESLISDSPCLNSQRGKILERNSCRLPFSNNVDVTARQNIPLLSSHQRVAIQMDIFNFGNLLNKNWGKQRVNFISGNSNIPLLSVTGMSTADRATAVPIVTYNPLPLDASQSGKQKEYQAGDFSGNYWRFQLSARVSF